MGLSILNNSFQRQLNGTGDAGTIISIEDRTPNEGEIIIYSIIAIENETSSNSDFDIGVNNRGEFISLKKYLNVSAADKQTYALNKIIVNYPSFLEIQIADTTDGDVLTVALQGYVIHNNDT